MRFLILNYVNYEVIIADDGSTDNTPKIVESLNDQDRHIILDRVTQNQGIGASLIRIIPKINTDFMIVVPGDGDVSVQGIKNLIDAIDDNDLAIGYYENDTRQSVRRFLSRSYTTLINYFFNTNINYVNGPSIYKTSILRNLPIKDLGFNTVMVVNLMALLRKHTYVNVSLGDKIRSSDSGNSLSTKTLVLLLKSLFYLFKFKKNNK